jgi:hypothetical protein
MIKSISLLAAFVSVAIATLAPTEPDGNVVANPGQSLTISWIDDNSSPSVADGWSSFKIEFMTGDNFNQTSLETVATGLNGASQSSYTWTVPTVNPPSKIYFFRFTSDTSGVSPAWTTRFTITGPDGTTTVMPTMPIEPDGKKIPWGVGSIVSGGTTIPPSNTGTGVVGTYSVNISSKVEDPGPSTVGAAATTPTESTSTYSVNISSKVEDPGPTAVGDSSAGPSTATSGSQRISVAAAGAFGLAAGLISLFL